MEIRRYSRGEESAVWKVYFEATRESIARDYHPDLIDRADVRITAKAFFFSRGFRITEAKSNIILGHPAPNFRMQKTLSSESRGPANRSQPIRSDTNRT